MCNRNKEKGKMLTHLLLQFKLLSEELNQHHWRIGSQISKQFFLLDIIIIIASLTNKHVEFQKQPDPYPTVPNATVHHGFYTAYKGIFSLFSH
jgi:hypothetical protein